MSHSRGAMLHMTLQLCQKMERAFERIVDGGKDGACVCGGGGAGSSASQGLWGERWGLALGGAQQAGGAAPYAPWLDVWPGDHAIEAMG